MSCPIEVFVEDETQLKNKISKYDNPYSRNYYKLKKLKIFVRNSRKNRYYTQ